MMPAMLAAASPDRNADNRSRRKMSPVLITSERRKNTIVSPSVCADGT